MSSYPFSRPLLATEHTEFDSGAERLALELAKRCDVTLAAVLPVLSNPEFEAVAPQLAERAEREAAAKLDALRAQAKASGVQLDVTIRRGAEIYREIVDEATRRSSDLIIVRRRGKQGVLANLLIGEMVSKVVSHAPCSVVFAPRAARMWNRGVLAAIDSSPSAPHVVQTAAKVARQCNLPLHIVSVVAHDSPALRNAAENALAHARAVASAAGISAGSTILHGKPFEQILESAKNLGTDLLVIGRHGESNVIRTPFGGTTQKVVGLSDAPVMVVHG